MFSVEKILLISSIFLQISYSEDLTTQKVSVRISGGEVCSGIDHSFVVSLETKDGYPDCAGSLLHYQWVLTTARCLETDCEKVVMGKNSVSEHTRGISARFAHPTHTTDIGLIKMDKPVELSSHVSFVKLPMGKYHREIDEICPTGILMGYGSQTEETFSSSELLCVELPILSSKQCKEMVGILDFQMCTLSAEGKGGCFGDSGSPLICKETGVQLGIFSGLSGHCGEKEAPNIHVRVDKHLVFILYTMAYKSGCINNCNNWNVIVISCILYFVTSKYINNII